MKPNESKYIERHEKMLEYQEQIKPFTPTIREISQIWGLPGTSPALSVLRKMVKRGMVIFREIGNRRHYYAVRIRND